MKIFLKKYGYWIILVLFLPIVINYILLIPVFLPIVGNNTTWLTFWGNYLSAIISSAVALVVLYRQLMQNQKENEANREANKKENEQNRKLQLNILQQQQAYQWLDRFRQASLDYLQIFAINDLKQIAADMQINPMDAHNALKTIIDRYGKNSFQFYLLCKQDEKTQQLINKLYPVYIEYKNILDDIQFAIISVKRNISFDAFCKSANNSMLSDSMKHILTHDTICSFFDALTERINSARNIEIEIYTAITCYIHTEQERIEKITETK